jgi:hypothetical protein
VVDSLCQFFPCFLLIFMSPKFFCESLHQLCCGIACLVCNTDIGSMLSRPCLNKIPLPLGIFLLCLSLCLSINNSTLCGDPTMWCLLGTAGESHFSLVMTSTILVCLPYDSVVMTTMHTIKFCYSVSDYRYGIATI